MIITSTTEPIIFKKWNKFKGVKRVENCIEFQCIKYNQDLKYEWRIHLSKKLPEMIKITGDEEVTEGVTPQNQ